MMHTHTPESGPDAVNSAIRTAPLGPIDARLAYIDALRAIAAILVLWTHVAEIFYSLSPNTLRSRWIYDWSHTMDFGRIGVVTFFAISGFVVPFSIKLGHRFPLREFLLKRFFRIFPAYWLSIPFGVLTAYWLWGRHFSLGQLFVNLTMLEYIFGVDPAIGLYWTLAVEFVFYVCCALLVLTGSIANYRRIALLVVILISIHVCAAASAMLGITRFDYGKTQWFLNIGIMFWGTLYRANMQHTDIGTFARISLWATLFFMLTIYPFGFKLWLGFPLVHTLTYSAGLLLFVAGTTVFRISLWPLPWLGAISYSIYLFHPVVFNPVRWVLLRLPQDSWWRSWHLGLYVVGILVLTVLVAALVYRLLEVPCIALGNRLARRWWGGEAVAGAQQKAPVGLGTAT